MSFIVKSNQESPLSNKKTSILNEINVLYKRVTLDQIKLTKNETFVIQSPLEGLVWFHILKGSFKSKSQ